MSVPVFAVLLIGAFAFGFWLRRFFDQPYRAIPSVPYWRELHGKLDEVDNLITAAHLGLQRHGTADPVPLNAAHRIVGECLRMLEFHPLERTVDEAVDEALEIDAYRDQVDQNGDRLERTVNELVDEAHRRMREDDLRGTSVGLREIEAAIDPDGPSSYALGPPEDDELVPILYYDPEVASSQAMLALDAPGILDRLRYGRHAGVVVTGIGWLPFRGFRNSCECVIVDESNSVHRELTNLAIRHAPDAVAEVEGEPVPMVQPDAFPVIGPELDREIDEGFVESGPEVFWDPGPVE